jgi:hypothetical protein
MDCFQHGAANGHPVKFIRDSGSSVSLIAEQALVELEIATGIKVVRQPITTIIKWYVGKSTVTNKVSLQISFGDEAFPVTFYVVPGNSISKYVLAVDVATPNGDWQNPELRPSIVERAMRNSREAAKKSLNPRSK